MRVRPLALLAIPLLVVACAQGAAPSRVLDLPSLSPASPATSTGGAPARLSQSPFPVASGPGGLPDGEAGWSPIGEPPAFREGQVDRIVSLDDGLIAVGCAGVMAACDAPAIWLSIDASDWSSPVRLPLLPGEASGTAKAAISVDDGIVVGGQVGRGDRVHAALWRLTDGGRIERVPDTTSFGDAAILHLARVGERLVAVGSGAYMEYQGFKAWHSDDAASWSAVPIAAGEGIPLAVTELEDGAVAWGPTCAVCPPETVFWRTADGIAWSDARREIAGRFTNVAAAGATASGLLAFGTTGIDPAVPAAWSQAAGSQDWTPADPPHQGDQRVHAYLPVGDGGVAAGTGLSGNRPTGFVWIRRPSETAWHQAAELPGVEVVGLVRAPGSEHLVLAGRVSIGDRSPIGLWLGSVGWES